MLLYNALRRGGEFMNLFNRLIVIVQLLITIAVMPIFIGILVFLRPGIVNTVDGIARSLVSGPNAALLQTLCSVLAALVFFVSVLLLFLELQRPSVRRLRVTQVADSRVEVTQEAITRRIDSSILQVTDIVKVKTRVVPANKGNVVDLFFDLETNPEVNVPQKTQEVIGVAKQVLGEQMGLQVGKIQVQIDYAKPKKQ